MNRQQLIDALREARSYYNIMREGCEPEQVDRYTEAQIASQDLMMSIIDELLETLVSRFPMRLKRDVQVSYVEDIDCTVIWQYMFLEEEHHGQPVIDQEPIQQTILGWYHGEPEQEVTNKFMQSTVIGNYYF